MTRPLLDRLAEGEAACAKIGLADASIYGEAKREIERLMARVAELEATIDEMEDESWNAGIERDLATP